MTGSYNARTKVRYAYETTYEYDESKGRKVQRRRCVGHFDPETGEVVPNGRRGRRPKEAVAPTAEPTGAATEGRADGLAQRCAELALACDRIAAEAARLAAELRDMARAVS